MLRQFTELVKKHFLQDLTLIYPILPDFSKIIISDVKHFIIHIPVPKFIELNSK
jgi:hypothetical protein